MLLRSSAALLAMTVLYWSQAGRQLRLLSSLNYSLPAGMIIFGAVIAREERPKQSLFINDDKGLSTQDSFFRLDLFSFAENRLLIVFLDELNLL
jgi:hypothetical protein